MSVRRRAAYVSTDSPPALEEAAKYLRLICEPLCTSDIEITPYPSHIPGEFVIIIQCEDDDASLLIGRKGATADALRVLGRVCFEAVHGETRRLDIRVRTRSQVEGGPRR